MLFTNHIAKKVQQTHIAPYTFLSLQLLNLIQKAKAEQKELVLVKDSEDG